MRTASWLVAAATTLTALIATATPAYAQLTSGEVPLTCKLSQERPYPIILVHGQSGNVEGMQAIAQRLTDERFCVYGVNHGFVQGGMNGQDHLWTSADQISEFVDKVMTTTGAKKVGLVGHSAGTGVIDNYLLAKGGASKVFAMVSFGGLHHPYWHLGVPGFADLDIYLPGVIDFAQKFFPGITIDQITDLIAPFTGDAVSTVQSPFVEDLFDKEYWLGLHGGPSEPPGLFIKMSTTDIRMLPTRDSAPNVCYTNLVAIGDMLVGNAAGTVDPGGHVANHIISDTVTGNAHSDMIGSPDGLNKMVEGFSKNCGNGGGVAPKTAPTLRFLDASESDVVASDAALEKKRQQRQLEFSKAFLKEIEKKYGDVLERSNVPFPGEEDQDSERSVRSAGACSMGPARDGQGTIAALLGAFGLAISARLRRRKQSR